MLGILGLGNYSTLHYINRINEEFNKINGGFSTCPFKMLNVNFNEINHYLPYKTKELAPIIERNIIELNKLEVTKILIPNITLHETVDQIYLPESIRNKITHPLNFEKVRSNDCNFSKFIVLGSLYMMESNYIAKKLKAEKVSLIKEELLEIDRIRTSIYSQGVVDEDLNWIRKFMNSYPNVTLVIACTELSILFSKIESKNPVIDLAEIQIKQALG